MANYPKPFILEVENGERVFMLGIDPDASDKMVRMDLDKATIMIGPKNARNIADLLITLADKIEFGLDP